MIGNESRDFLREDDHRNNAYNRSPKQNGAQIIPLHRAQPCVALLPKSNSQQYNGKRHGRNLCTNALAPAAPNAPANPKGRQHPIVTSELTIAPRDAEMPEPFFELSVCCEASTCVFPEFICS